MHDPMTVAFNIPNPFAKRYSWGKRWSQRPSIATIWHVDPESDGSDDSCGWFSPHLTKDQESIIGCMAETECLERFYTRRAVKENHHVSEMLDLMTCAFTAMQHVANKKVTPEEARAWAVESICSQADNFRASLCFLPGWHSNSVDGRGVDHARRFFSSVTRWIIRENRPWWRRPRWHVHHWRIQIHVVEAFKRWAFTRCCECGGRFQWGASGVGVWHSDGPRWFASENLTHMDCADDRVRKYPTHEDAIDAMGEEEKP